jgi:hypothetical protein
MLAAALASAPPATAAFIEDVECFFEPGDVPGVDVFFPAECTQFTSTSGVVTVIAKGRLPEGFTLERTHVGPIPCFVGTGRIVATTHGRVLATCRFKP